MLHFYFLKYDPSQVSFLYNQYREVFLIDTRSMHDDHQLALISNDFT